MDKENLVKIIDLIKNKVLENKILRAVLLVCLSSVFFGVSYSFYEGGVIGNDTAKENVVSTGDLTLNFSDSTELTLENATPGDKMSKTFTIENDGDYAVNYNILWDSLTNTFEDVTDLVYDLEGNTEFFYNKQVPDSGENIKIVKNIRIEPGTTHTYTLTLKYLNKNEEQNDNNGKTITGKLLVTTNKTTDGYGLASEIIKNNTPTSFSTTPGSSLSTTDEGLINGAQDNDGNTLYFRGNVVDNYVSFAGKTWRVIRINGDGSVRMILDGTTGTTCKWNSSKDTTYNNTYQTDSYDKMVSWLTYSNSPLKTNLETWYSNNIANNAKYKRYVVKSNYCSDLFHSGNTRETTMYIGTRNRVKSPTFKCPEQYTYNLNVATINADEVLFAGAKNGTANSDYYLYTGAWYWTMSPYYWSTEAKVNTFRVRDDGTLYNTSLSGTGGVRPVINLKGDTPVTVNETNPGTSTNPYVVDGDTESSTSNTLGEPGKLQFTNVTTSGLKVSWEAANNATYYIVERKTGTNAFEVINDHLTTNEITDSELSTFTTYTYRVQACNESGCNVNKRTSSMTTKAELGNVTNFRTLYISGTYVNLAWRVNGYASYFKLERKTGNEDFYVVNGSVTEIPYYDELTDSETTYTYRIRACAKGNDGTEYCGEPTTLTVTTDIYVGSSGIPTITETTNSKIVLSWSAGENATSYDVYRKISGTERYENIAEDNTTTSFVDSGLTGDTTYDYRIEACAYNKDSNKVCAEPRYITGKTDPAIGTVSSFAASNITKNSMSLNWASATNAEYYVLERKASSASSYTTLSTGSTNLSYSDSGLTEATNYTYRVRACRTSSTNTTYCGTNSTINVSTLFDPINLYTFIEDKSPTSTGTVNSNGLMKVSHSATGQTPEQTEYRYTGKTVNNYVSYNGELWRMIGGFSVDNGSGTYENRVKIIRDTKLSSTMAWNSAGTNDWTTASLKTYLNGDYYNSLTSTAQNMIEDAKWYISPVYNQSYASVAFNSERASTSSASGSNTNWTGKIAIMYPSDYGYGSSTCYTGTKDLYWYDDSTCYSTNWLFKNDTTYWYLSPLNSGTSNALSCTSSGYVNPTSTSTSYAIRPTTYLKSKIKVESGSGTSADPYQIIVSTELEEPGSVSLSNITSNSIKVSWGEAANATYYKVERKTGEGNYTTLSENVTNKEYSDTGLSASTSYTYRITSCNAGGCHSTTKTNTASTAAAIGEISTFSYSDLEQRKVTLSWTTSSNATYYKVERKLSSASTYTMLSNNATGLSYNATGLKTATAYNFKVTPCATSSTNTEYCGTSKTLSVTTLESTGEDLSLVDEVISKAPTSTGTVNSAGLMKVEQAATGQTPSQTEYRYSGANSSVNNYVLFNNETWRIIGVFSTDNGSGTYENRVKIIKDSKLSSDMTWNSTTSNDWTSASLNTYLNGTYYNGLDSTAKEMINDAKWYISATDFNNVASYQYTVERASTSTTSSGSVTLPISWTGKIALMNPSDYGYASSGCYTGIKTLYDYDNSTCYSSNWLFKNDAEYWLFSPYSSDSMSVLRQDPSGYVNSCGTNIALGVRPVTYLKSNVIVTGGDGTSSDSYEIELSTAVGVVNTVSSSNLETTTLTLNWTSAVNATYYKIERKLSSASEYTVLSNNATSLSYNDTGLTAATSYDYRVTACSASGCGTPKIYTITTDVEPVSLANTLISKAPTSTGTINSEGLMKVEQAATDQTSAGTEYRFSGRGNACSYNNGAYYYHVTNNDCPTLYDYTSTRISDSQNFYYTYQTSIPDDTSVYTYEQTASYTGTYVGTSVKNYITFNNETWRIVGVFPTDNGNGVYEDRVRIIRSEKLSNTHLWDESNSNDWTEASLKTYLNGTYHNSLTSSAQGQIGDAKWYISATTAYESTLLLQYAGERASTSNANGNHTNWTGKIALLYPSDYGYASSGCYNSNKTLKYYSDTECYTSDWLYNKDNGYWWLLTPDKECTYCASQASPDGGVSRLNFGNTCANLPVTNLNSNVSITGGTGTPSDPYTIKTSNSLISINTLTTSNVSPTTLTLNWTTNNNATYYKVERKLSTSSSYTVLSNSVNNLYFNDTGLTSNTSYDYRVTPCTNTVCGVSKAITITTSRQLGEINTITSSNLDTTSLTLNWSSATDATYYKVERKLSSASEYTTLSSNVTALSYNDTGLTSNTSYDYRVTPCMESACGVSKTITFSTAIYSTLSNALIAKSPTSTGTINSEGLMKLEQAATGQTPAQTEYRYSGAGINCSYNNGGYITPKKSSECPVLYNYTSTKIADGSTSNSTYQTSVPSNTSTYTYTQTASFTGSTVDSLVKNYVTFNNETWRIIGVFSTDDGNGNYENRVKIVKDKALDEKKVWNTTVNVNDWTISSLKNFLNGEYYEGLQLKSKALIDNAKWYISPADYYSQTLQNYKNERLSTSTAVGGKTNWTGKVGLIYPSDYGYASSSCYSGTSICYYYTNSCINSDWMFDGSDLQMTISPKEFTESSSYAYKFVISSSGGLNTSSLDGEQKFKPTVYLKSNVEVVNGTGTSSDPYILDIGSTSSSIGNIATVSYMNLESRALTLHWTSAYQATYYKIERKLTSEGSYTTLTNNATDIYYDDSGLTPNTSYDYKITPCTNSICGTSKTLTVTTPNPGTLLTTSIINKAPTTTGSINSDGLMKVEQDATDQTPAQTEYRYSGANSNVKNYIKFNNELWRIIGVFSTDNGTGTYENRVKIIRNSSVGKKVWNSPSSSDWASSSLSTYFNGDYYNNLSTNAQYKVSAAKWYIDSPSTYSTASENYAKERKTLNWIGKVGTLVPSDYQYAGSECYSSYTFSNYSTDTCKNNNWLYANDGNYYWTMTNSSGYVIFIGNTGGGNYTSSTSSFATRPIVYLTSNINLLGGTGTSSDPYLIEKPSVDLGTINTISYSNLETVSLNLNWTSATNATYYKVERKLSSATTYTTLTSSTPDLYYFDSGLTANTSYDYRVTPCEANNCGTAKTLTVTTESSSNSDELVDVLISKSPTTTGTINSDGLMKVNHSATNQTPAQTEYRYSGRGKACSYNNGDYYYQVSSTVCPTLYDYKYTLLSNNYSYTLTYQTSVPSNTSTYSYEQLASYSGTYVESLVNNYITFNNETWRIVGVFPTDDGNGNYSNRVKIVKDASLGSIKWNTYQTTDWTISSLKTYLNGDYYNNLTSTARNQIDTVKWYIVALDTGLTSEQAYINERASTSSSDGTTLSINWTGNIGLLYASDYGYSSSGCYYGVKRMFDYGDNACKTSAWIYKNDSKDYWLINPYNNNGMSSLIINSYAQVTLSAGMGTTDPREVLPTLYLKSTVKVTGGTGTSTNPYTIG